MAMTNAEKVRAYRERQKAKKKADLTTAEGPALDNIMRTPFFKSDALEGNWTDFQMELDLVGIEAPSFMDDSGAQSLSGEIEVNNATYGAEDGSDDPYRNAKDSLGRAEMTVGALIAAAVSLADIINTHKRKEITDRIHEIETSDLSDPDTRKQALTDIVRLKKMLEQLDKQVRWTFPQWKVTGE